jgi:hypothetical protein
VPVGGARARAGTKVHLSPILTCCVWHLTHYCSTIMYYERALSPFVCWFDREGERGIICSISQVHAYSTRKNVNNIGLQLSWVGKTLRWDTRTRDPVCKSLPTSITRGYVHMYYRRTIKL